MHQRNFFHAVPLVSKTSFQKKKKDDGKKSPQKKSDDSLKGDEERKKGNEASQRSSGSMNSPGAASKSEGGNGNNSPEGGPWKVSPPPKRGAWNSFLRRSFFIFIDGLLLWWIITTIIDSTRPQLSLQEFLSQYVAKGAVQKVQILGSENGVYCRAWVTDTPFFNTNYYLNLMHPQNQLPAAYNQPNYMVNNNGVVLPYQQLQPSNSLPNTLMNEVPETKNQLHVQQQNVFSFQNQIAPEKELFSDVSLVQPSQNQIAQGQYLHSLASGNAKNDTPITSSPSSRSSRIVYFKTGLPAESFIEKMESFQRSLGISPLDYIPIIVTGSDGPSFFGLILPYLFFGWLFLRMQSAAAAAASMNAMGGGRTGGINRFMFANKLQKQKNVISAIRFKDVAGMREAKNEIQEFVSFLKSPNTFRKLGAKLPKGALLCGPPGTGKTLLAKAVAGEAGVPFYSVSGSDFVEMYVGLGAARVRELFEEARKNSPSIIFIDEIDGVGGRRNQSMGNSEREQTLNQLLVEMDGFTPTTHVVVLAGTNRDDMLDNALKRPGRFDRIVKISRPDISERKEIFMVHLKPIKLHPSIDIDQLADRLAALTPGFVGADIANICNESAIFAARRKVSSGVEQIDFERAVERTIAGLPMSKKSLLSTEQRKLISYHEVGHAVCGWFLKYADPVLKVTIVPRSSGAMGFAQHLPSTVELFSRDELLDKITVCLGGRAAEEVFLKGVSSGAVDDLKKATRMARMVISTLGMGGDEVGLIQWDDPTEQSQMKVYRPYSEQTAQRIDDEVKELMKLQYSRAKTLLNEKTEQVHTLAKLLLDKETITYADIVECIGDRPFEPNEQLRAFIEAKPTKIETIGSTNLSEKSTTEQSENNQNLKNIY